MRQCILGMVKTTSVAQQALCVINCLVDYIVKIRRVFPDPSMDSQENKDTRNKITHSILHDY